VCGGAVLDCQPGAYDPALDYGGWDPREGGGPEGWLIHAACLPLACRLLAEEFAKEGGR
jgi:hypothetical protein